MKFWKPVLTTSILYLAFIFTLVYSACEKDPCSGVFCEHGGSCANSVCSCPSGYEGPTCHDKTTDRYLGTYVGTITCDNGAPLIDTVFVTYRGPTSLNLRQKTSNNDILIGSVTSNETTYAIAIPDKVDSATHYDKKYRCTLQSDNKLTLDTYESVDSVTNHHCVFIGFKI